MSNQMGLVTADLGLFWAQSARGCWKAVLGGCAFSWNPSISHTLLLDLLDCGLPLLDSERD